jgi:hypothetical protein
MLLADPDLAAAVRRNPDLQRQMCDPRENPNAAAFFIFNFCLTQDEERGGEILPLPPPIHPMDTPKTPWYGPGEPSWVLKWVEALDAPRLDPHNVHDEKSRRMLHTWVACFYVLWSLMWVRGSSWLLLSKTKDHIDDSGRSTKVFSLFSRMRFAYDRLPDHVRKIIDFTYMSAVCAENDAWGIGRAPDKDAGRAGGFMRALVDECSYLLYMVAIHQALDPACKFGKVYMATVNGTDNEYARIEKEKPEGWRYFKCDWKEDPAKTKDVRETLPGPERDRYGSHTSSWFMAATASLTDEVIGQEYGRSYERSTVGRVHREYRFAVHVRQPEDPRGPLRYDPSLELRVGLDPGHARKCAAVIGQPVLEERLRVIGAFAGEQRNAGDNAKDLVEYLRHLGYEGELGEVVLNCDPASLNEEMGPGLELISWFRAAGLEQVELPRIQGPNSIYLGNNVVRVMFQRNLIEIAYEAKALWDFIPKYRLPVDPRTGTITSNVPMKNNMANHPNDALRYLVTSIWTADDLPYDGFITEARVRDVDKRYKDLKRQGRFTDGHYSPAPAAEDDEDVFAPIASSRRGQQF